MKPRLFLLFLMTSAFFYGEAQMELLKGKRVAIYFSKKQLSFDEQFNAPVSQFIVAHMGKSHIVTDLKTELLICLGELISTQVRDSGYADSAWFVSADPEAAKEVVSSWTSDKGLSGPLSEHFKGTDYLIVISSMALGHSKGSSLYVKSNRIITEPVLTDAGRIQISIYDPADGTLVFSGESCAEEKTQGGIRRFFDFHSQESPTGNFLSALISAGFSIFIGGEEQPCPQE